MRKRYTAAIKAKIVIELLKEEKPLSQLASEYEVSSKQLTRWKNQALAEMPRLLFQSPGEKPSPLGGTALASLKVQQSILLSNFAVVAWMVEID